MGVVDAGPSSPPGDMGRGLGVIGRATADKKGWVDEKRGHDNGKDNDEEGDPRQGADEGMRADVRSIPPRPRSLPLVMDDEGAEAENALTAHYSRIVRTIDSRYTIELDRLRQEMDDLRQAHAAEVAVVRNDMDAAYRAVLKKRDQEVEKATAKATTRTEELEQEVLAWKDGEVARVKREAEEERERLLEGRRREVERERNAVEDVWERRWKDRMALEEEEAARRVRERDGEWVRFLEGRFPMALEKAKEMMLLHDEAFVPGSFEMERSNEDIEHQYSDTDGGHRRS